MRRSSWTAAAGRMHTSAGSRLSDRRDGQFRCHRQSGSSSPSVPSDGGAIPGAAGQHGAAQRALVISGAGQVGAAAGPRRTGRCRSSRMPRRFAPRRFAPRRSRPVRSWPRRSMPARSMSWSPRNPAAVAGVQAACRPGRRCPVRSACAASARHSASKVPAHQDGASARPGREEVGHQPGHPPGGEDRGVAVR